MKYEGKYGNQMNFQPGTNFGTRGQRSSRLGFGRSTGNDVSGHYDGSGQKPRVRPFSDPVGYFGYNESCLEGSIA